MDGIAVNGPIINLSKSLIMVKFLVKKFEKYFQMENLIDRRDYKSHFLHQIVAYGNTGCGFFKRGIQN